VENLVLQEEDLLPRRERVAKESADKEANRGQKDPRPSGVIREFSDLVRGKKGDSSSKRNPARGGRVSSRDFLL